MDIAIFLFALFQLAIKKYHWVFAAIFILTSYWLEIWFGTDAYVSLFPFYHKTTDTGFVLFCITFIYSIIKFGVNKFPVLKINIIIFLLFLVVNSMIDIIDNISINDVIRYCRGWIYLSVIWMHPKMYSQYIYKILKILLVVVFFTTIIIIWQNLSQTYTFAEPISMERGIKPSFYVMLFIPILFFNALKYSPIPKWTMIVIFSFSIVMNLKQTYLLTVIFTLLATLFMFQRKQLPRRLVYAILIFIGCTILFNTNDKIRNRIEESLTVTESIKYKFIESTASYRMLHVIERFNYIVKDPKTAIRGIGFIREESYKKAPFYIGNYNRNIGKKSQLDTPDIAWSNFFVRFGLLGTIIFLFMYVSIVKHLYRQADFSPISQVFSAFLIVCLCFTSFGNAVISYGYFYLIPLIVILSSTQNKKSGLNHENSSPQFYLSTGRNTCPPC